MASKPHVVAMRIDPEECPHPSIDVDSLYAAHAVRLRAVVRRRVGDTHLAEDIVQETFLRVHRFHDRLDPRRPAWPWLRTIALRLAAGATRLRRFSAEELVAEHAERAGRDGPTEHVERVDSQATLIAMLASLPERQRRLLVLRDMYGVGYDELVHSEGVTVTALRMASSRAREALRRHDLVTRLGALAPVGWLTSGLRRLRRAAAVASGVPAGSVVAAAIVVAVSFSVGQALEQSPPTGFRAAAPVAAGAPVVKTSPAPVEAGAVAHTPSTRSEPSFVADDAVGEMQPIPGVVAPDREPVASQPAAPAAPEPASPSVVEGPQSPDRGLPLVVPLPGDGDVVNPPPARTGPAPPVGRLCSLPSGAFAGPDPVSPKTCSEAAVSVLNGQVPSGVPSQPEPAGEPAAFDAQPPAEGQPPIVELPPTTS